MTYASWTPGTCTVSGTTVTATPAGTARYAGDANHSAILGGTSLSVAASPLPLPGNAGHATVDVQGPAGCLIQSPVFSATPPSGTPTPPGMGFPLGVFSFTATGTGCGSAALTVRIDYPAGTLNGLQPRKYGPSAAHAAPAWFAHGTATGDSVYYIVEDNGVGDNDPVLGQISDPFAPLAAAGPGPGGAAAIPTLGQWGVMLLSLMAAAVGASAMRRTRACSH